MRFDLEYIRENAASGSMYCRIQLRTGRWTQGVESVKEGANYERGDEVAWLRL